MDLPTVLSSGVVAGLVAGLVTLRTTERKIAIENITQQRQQWRDKVRDLAQRIKLSYRNDKTEELHSQYVEMQLLLNPEDSDDKSILDTIWKMIEKSTSEDLHIELGEKLSLLLKHDWERAKTEAKPAWYWLSETERTSYENFKSKRISS
ncbi:hypothetical protein [Nitrosomonas marina]|uniref:Uncharacterized protein n=1 Tax=Nitrosomonas marina TaxID=917 RepID=A0A1H8DW07_9PROT|nr:hypothetical protein [Nitrosomonas marina]SEN11491.1 hypothetical protein SAMN05216325_10811 [Nitrosomonas marina]